MTGPRSKRRYDLAILLHAAFASVLAGTSALSGCLRPEGGGGRTLLLPVRQKRFSDFLAKVLLAVKEDPRPVAFSREWLVTNSFEVEIRTIMDGHKDTSHLVISKEHSEVLVYDVSTTSPAPCLPEMVGTEFLQMLFNWRVSGDPAFTLEILRASAERFAWLRNVPWQEVIEFGWGAFFSAPQAVCAVLDEMQVPSEELDSADVFEQYYALYGFDYRDCIHEFTSGGSPGHTSPIHCHSPEVQHDSRGDPNEFNAQKWPHRRFESLALHSRSTCGTLCRLAVAFARVAQLLLLRPRADRCSSVGVALLSSDEAMLLKEAQFEIGSLEYFFIAGGGVDRSVRFCSYINAVPILTLLARAGCVEEDAIASPLAPSPHRVLVADAGGASGQGLEAQEPVPMEAEVLGCQENLPGNAYVTGWPPQQRLTSAGSLVAYTLLDRVGSLMDAFGVRWWAAHGTLLGALRHGGLLLQECDVDLAVWRRDAHAMVGAKFRAALAFAGVQMFQLPNYFVFRFCMVHTPLVADTRSVDGFVSCRLPYVDGHLADVVPFNTDRWDYIHRHDKRYGINFPLAGLLRVTEQGDVLADARVRVKFGDYGWIWVPQLPNAAVYLTDLYGSDWATVVRQRDGTLLDEHGRRGLGSIVHNGNVSGMQGMFARPSGPFRDVVAELKSMGGLL